MSRPTRRTKREHSLLGKLARTLSFLPGVHDSGLRSRIVLAYWLFAALVGFAVLTLAGADYVASLPALCGVCHEMAPKVAAWTRSAHAKIGCYACHATPKPAYLWPQSVLAREQRLGLEIASHLRGAMGEPIALASGVATAVPEVVCRQCHSLGRTATRDGIRIDHAVHARRNMSCVSCHLRTAHPDPSRDRGSLVMGECFACHGLSAAAKAPGRCDTCHTKDFDLLPTSHKSLTWRAPGHGRVAKTDRQQCRMCHLDAFCRDCHGLDMPHTASWRVGKEGHRLVGSRRPDICARCHVGGPDLCSRCHHEAAGYDSTKGPWIAQHFSIVRATGGDVCFKCHSPMSCSDCHVTGKKVAAGP